MKTLSVSCVGYNSSPPILLSTIQALTKACDFARQQKVVDRVELYLIDNGPAEADYQLFIKIKELVLESFNSVNILTGHGNLGYGKGNNLILEKIETDYHLILNPDVLLEIDALSIGIDYLNSHTNVGLLAPDAFTENGNRQFLAKRNPNLVILFLRAVNSEALNRIFESYLSQYEYRDALPAIVPIKIELASGCFMLMRTTVFKAIHGFSKKYFMYFEDFDISLKVNNIADVVHHPDVKIIHHGGNASRKGLKHIIFFMTSYFKFKLTK